MAIYTFRTNTYARNIYLYGTERLTARDGYNGVPAEYYVPVEQKAAELYSNEQIGNALTQGWINQTEYDETMA
jgi:hypothetical protein